MKGGGGLPKARGEAWRVKPEQVSLKIDVFTPETLPMARLARYLEELAAMLGSDANLHFSRVAAGSAHLIALADPPAAPKVLERARAVAERTAPRSSMAAHARLDDLLAEDNAIGELFVGRTKLLEFPGRRRAAQEVIGPVSRSGSIDGRVFSIAGKDESINVRLLGDSGGELRCVVSVELARRLGPHLLGGRLRLFGRGVWNRVDAQWVMKAFEADEFVVLDDSPLPDTLRRLQAVFEGVSADEFVSAMSDLREA
ncbi:MAG TPA: hypothetical protein DEH78_05545 [Solibacterales bacterium]|nr:hypothetical protein [Bryobacterales bacterium]